MFLSKSDEETTSNRKLAKDLVDKWVIQQPLFAISLSVRITGVLYVYMMRPRPTVIDGIHLRGLLCLFIVGNFVSLHGNAESSHIQQEHKV